MVWLMMSWISSPHALGHIDQHDVGDGEVPDVDVHRVTMLGEWLEDRREIRRNLTILQALGTDRHKGFN